MSPLFPQSSKVGLQTLQVVQMSEVFLAKVAHEHPSSGGGSTSEKLTKILGAFGLKKAVSSQSLVASRLVCIPFAGFPSPQPSEENLL